MASSNQAVVISMNTSQGQVPLFMYNESRPSRRREAANTASRPTRSSSEGTIPRSRRAQPARVTPNHSRHNRFQDSSPPVTSRLNRRHGQTQVRNMNRPANSPNGLRETTSAFVTYQRHDNLTPRDPIWTSEAHLRRLRPRIEREERRSRGSESGESQWNAREDFSQLCSASSTIDLDDGWWRDPSMFRLGLKVKRDRLELKMHWIKSEARHRIKGAVEATKRISSRLIRAGFVKRPSSLQAVDGIAVGDSAVSVSQYINFPPFSASPRATSRARQISRREGFLQAVDARQQEQNDAGDEYLVQSPDSIFDPRNLQGASRPQDVQGALQGHGNILDIDIDDLVRYIASMNTSENSARVDAENQQLLALARRREAQLEEEEESIMWLSHIRNLADEEEYWGRRTNAQAWARTTAERQIEVEYARLRSGGEQLPVYQGINCSPPPYPAHMSLPSYDTVFGAGK
ncbi:hypothetical protein BP5796_11391 [Coleophoma crateriformis]|uniref:Uncharacterized protein n=1 Tax=Coleophoma crateriformis TaxID=565419 RepID=A0A3D8QI89_9HELO|nr:hypothetical protein BP5796_11391 [Coleophoma crateriformis]